MNARITQDVKVLATDLQELLKATASHTGERIAAARARVEDSLYTAQEALAIQLEEAAKATNRYVHESPWQTAGFAALAGAVIGFLVGRR